MTQKATLANQWLCYYTNISIEVTVTNLLHMRETHWAHRPYHNIIICYSQSKYTHSMELQYSWVWSCHEYTDVPNVSIKDWKLMNAIKQTADSSVEDCPRLCITHRRVKQKWSMCKKRLYFSSVKNFKWEWNHFSLSDQEMRTSAERRGYCSKSSVLPFLCFPPPWLGHTSWYQDRFYIWFDPVTVDITKFGLRLSFMRQ